MICLNHRIINQGLFLLYIYSGQKKKVKVVLEGYRRCPDSHDLSEKNIPTSTGKKYFASPGPLTFFFWPLY